MVETSALEGDYKLTPLSFRRMWEATPEEQLSSDQSNKPPEPEPPSEDAGGVFAATVRKVINGGQLPPVPEPAVEEEVHDDEPVIPDAIPGSDYDPKKTYSTIRDFVVTLNGNPGRKHENLDNYNLTKPFLGQKSIFFQKIRPFLGQKFNFSKMCKSNQFWPI